MAIKAVGSCCLQDSWAAALLTHDATAAPDIMARHFVAAVVALVVAGVPTGVHTREKVSESVCLRKIW